MGFRVWGLVSESIGLRDLGVVVEGFELSWDIFSYLQLGGRTSGLGTLNPKP